MENGKSRRSRGRSKPELEPLESRVVLYSASGNAWPAAQLVTISFMPDGTDNGGKVSNLQSSFNASFGSTSNWQNVIIKAAQTWAGSANINSEVVPDNGAPQGSGASQQGDPGFGDIRIGGYNFNSSSDQDGAGWGIYARRFDAAGTPQGAEFRISESTSNDQLQPTIAMSGSGAFTVAWSGNAQDGSGWGTHARRYAVAGLPLGTEFLVNTFKTRDQQYPEVAMSDTGNLVITWASRDQDGSGWGVYARRYDALGISLGGEFLVNAQGRETEELP